MKVVVDFAEEAAEATDTDIRTELYRLVENGQDGLDEAFIERFDIIAYEFLTRDLQSPLEESWVMFVLEAMRFEGRVNHSASCKRGGGEK